jgi:hypothetical protein
MNRKKLVESSEKNDRARNNNPARISISNYKSRRFKMRLVGWHSLATSPGVTTHSNPKNMNSYEMTGPC